MIKNVAYNVINATYVTQSYMIQMCFGITLSI